MIKKDPSFSQESAPKIIKLEKLYDLTIGDSSIQSLIDHLLEARKEEDKDNVKAFEDALKSAREQRLLLLDLLINNENVIYKNSGNMEIKRDQLEKIIADIDRVINIKEKDESGLLDLERETPTEAELIQKLKEGKVKEPENIVETPAVETPIEEKSPEPEKTPKPQKVGAGKKIHADSAHKKTKKTTHQKVVEITHTVEEMTEGDKKEVSKTNIEVPEVAVPEIDSVEPETKENTPYESIADIIKDYDTRWTADRTPELKAQIEDLILQKKLSLTDLVSRLEARSPKISNKSKILTVPRADLRELLKLEEKIQPVKKEKVYKSLSKKIEAYSVKLDAERGEKLEKEIEKFTSKNLYTARELIKKINPAARNIGNEAYMTLSKDVEALFGLKQKAEKKPEEAKPEPEKIEEPEKTTPEDTEEAISHFDYVLKSIMNDRYSEEVRQLFEYNKEMMDELEEQINNLKKTEAPESVDEFIEKHEETVNTLLFKIRHTEAKGGLRKGGEISDILKDILVYLNTLKSTYIKPTPKNPKTPPTPPTTPPSTPGTATAAPEKPKGPKQTKFEKRDLTKEFSMEDMSVLSSNKDLQDRIIDSMREYNKKIDRGAKASVLQKDFEYIQDLEEEWHAYKEYFYNNRKVVKQKFGQKADSGNKEDDDVISKTAARARREEEARKASPGTPPTPSTPPTPAAEATIDVDVEEIRNIPKKEDIFTVKEGKDYGDLATDKEFDKWLNGMYQSMLERGEATSSRSDDIESWYQKYQEAAPYKEKLDIMFADYKKKNPDANEISIMMREDKIRDLMYEMVVRGTTVKGRIDRMFDTYQEIERKNKEIERIKKLNKLRDSINAGRAEKPDRDLKSDHVKTVLEARGDVNIEENISELTDFLKNIQGNYDFYARGIKSEAADNNIKYIFRNYTSAGKDTSGKLGLLSRIGARIKAFLPGEVDHEGLSEFSSMIKKVRELDLVDRKNGKKDKVSENKTKMISLIRFISEEEGDLIKYLKNPDSLNIETLDTEQKDMLKTFSSMYNVFTQSKYRNKESQEKAKEILDKGDYSGMDEAEYRKSTIRSSDDLLFDDVEEATYFEQEARYQINKKQLKDIDETIAAFPPRTKNLNLLKKLTTEFDEVKKVLEALGDGDMDALAIKKVELKLGELRVRHINKDSYEELSESFAAYDAILESTDITKEVKTTYITELIAALEKQKAKKGNTFLQNFALDGIIEKYKKELLSL